MAISENQIVSMEYEVRVNGDVVDSNVSGDPLIFLTGKGQIIPGLENGMAHMAIGEKGDVLVKAKDAYGEYSDEAQQEVPKDQFAGIELSTGMTLYGQGEDGGTVQVIVKDIGAENIIIDFNHPLAGKDLMFSVAINNIRDASADEAMSGVPAENQAEADACCSTDGGGHSCGCN